MDIEGLGPAACSEGRRNDHLAPFKAIRLGLTGNPLHATSGRSEYRHGGPEAVLSAALQLFGLILEPHAAEQEGLEEYLQGMPDGRSISSQDLTESLLPEEFGPFRAQ
jgi:hypothetical protein